MYDRRSNATDKLEAAENALLTTAAKLRAKKLKKEAKAAKKSGAAPSSSTPIDAEGRPLTRTSLDDLENNVSLAEKLVPQNKRPSHRLPLGFMPFALPFVGKKVDSINWARDEIVVTNDLLAKGRAVIDSQAPEKLLPPRPFDASSAASNDVENGDKKDAKPAHEYPPLNSAFITFNQQIAAHLAVNALSHHDPYRMSGRYAEIAPEDVIWGNLGLNAYEAKIRMLISYAATAGLIIFWAIPGKPLILPLRVRSAKLPPFHSCFRCFCV